MFSIARLQKYQFCPRAFYFRYKKPPEFFPEDLVSSIFHFKNEDYRETSTYFLLYNLVSAIFYLRPESNREIKRMVYLEAGKLGVAQDKSEDIIEPLFNFLESDFYLSTSPALTSHLLVDNPPVIQIGDKEATGQVHMAWVGDRGKLNVVRVSKKGEEADTSFAILYALKKFQADPQKLNVGVLNPLNWSCSWLGIDWHQISEFQENALSFCTSEDFSEYNPTENQSRCQVCIYSSICNEHTSELDSL